MESILDSTKKVLGLDSSYTAFDVDVTMHINSVFATLQQLGVGPAEGFAIADKDTKWAAYLGGDLNLNQVKSYIYLRVRLLFDPPATSYAQEAMARQIKEIEWRLSVYRDGVESNG